MKDHTDCRRQFIQLSRAWYADAIVIPQAVEFIRACMEEV